MSDKETVASDKQQNQIDCSKVLDKVRQKIETGKYEDALYISKKVSRYASRNFGNGHHYVHEAIHLHGKTYHKMGKLNEARAYFTELLELIESTCGENDSEECAMIWYDLGKVLIDQGNFTLASVKLERAARIISRSECYCSAKADIHIDWAVALVEQKDFYRGRQIFESGFRMHEYSHSEKTKLLEILARFSQVVARKYDILEAKPYLCRYVRRSRGMECDQLYINSHPIHSFDDIDFVYDQVNNSRNINLGRIDDVFVPTFLKRHVEDVAAAEC
ncbi:tetratricopeptide repeat protein [Desulfonatronum parangueonense]